MIKIKMTQKNKNNKILIFGGGLTGLSSAWKLSAQNFKVELVEKTNKPGGISSSFKYKQFSLDYGPHKIYTQLPHILKTIKKLEGDNLLTIQKKSRVRLMGKYYNYPIGFMDILLRMNPLIGIKCALSGIFSLFTPNKKSNSYEDYIVNRFGKGIYRLVFGPYADKVWGNPKRLSIDLAEIRVPMKNISHLLINMITSNKNKPEFSADQFYYPKNGIIDLSNRMATKIKSNHGKILFNTTPQTIKIKNNRVKSVILKSGRKKIIKKPDFVISTIPINELPLLIKPHAPKKVIESCKKIKHRSLILVYVIVDKPRLFNDNWIFYPEKEFVFNRLCEQKGFSEFTGPKNNTILTVEITCAENERVWSMSEKELFNIVVKDLEKVSILKKSDVIEYFTKKISNVYPVYDLEYKKNLLRIIKYLDSIENLITNGRQGLFNYNNMDHCIDMGFIAAEHIIKGKSSADWIETRKKFDSYRIVD